ncbi:hypothetical protein [Noviherbaspirillum sp.]|uniref:hypothetical protein n=1 Tax=Noviherbaspirillum sp. TaxID=1926288 RepID=UPI002FE10ED2
MTLSHLFQVCTRGLEIDKVAMENMLPTMFPARRLPAMPTYSAVEVPARMDGDALRENRFCN